MCLRNILVFQRGYLQERIPRSQGPPEGKCWAGLCKSPVFFGFYFFVPWTSFSSGGKFESYQILLLQVDFLPDNCWLDTWLVHLCFSVVLYNGIGEVEGQERISFCWWDIRYLASDMRLISLKIKHQRTSTLQEVWCPNHRRRRAQLELAEAHWNVKFNLPTII